MEKQKGFNLTPIFDEMLEGVQVLSPNLTYLYVNKTVARQGKKSVEELLGKSMLEVYPGIENSSLFHILQDCLNNKEPHKFENRFEYEDGTFNWFHLIVQPHELGILILSVDITAQKMNEIKKHQYKRMESIARLAAGVAHDFNNKLSIIELSFKHLINDGTFQPKIVRNIEHAIESSKQLVSTLANFVKEENMSAVTEVNCFLTSFYSQYDLLTGKDITITLDLSNDPCPVNLKQVQLDQIFLNLVVNAKDAISDKGNITVSTMIKSVNSPIGVSHDFLEEGSYVYIEFKDDGNGIKPDVLEKIFQFYFTTKEEGKGTGLGLPTIQNIIQTNGGVLDVESIEGKGTTFKVWLPLSKQPYNKPI